MNPSSHNTTLSETLSGLPNLGEEKEQYVYPRVEHAFWIHRINRKGPQNERELTKKLIDYINKNNLCHLYKHVCENGVAEFDQAKFDSMLSITIQIIDKINKRKEEIQENFDEIALKDLNNYHSNFLSFIGDKSGSTQFLIDNFSSCSTTAQQIENYMHRCRIGFFYRDRQLVGDSLTAIDELIVKANDWHLKNLNYAYKGLFNLWNRSIKDACTNFSNCVSSFSAYDIMPLPTFCSYTAITSLLVITREKFHSRIINGSEVQEGLYSAPVVKGLCEAFYSCHYRQYIDNLKLYVEEILNDPFCHEHVDYLCRQFRLKAYNQLFVSFKSLTLKYLSEEFCLNMDFIEKDISKFIVDGSLNCKIDLVKGMVVITQRDIKNKDFKNFLSEYDRCISSIQFLERIVND